MSHSATTATDRHLCFCEQCAPELTPQQRDHLVNIVRQLREAERARADVRMRRALIKYCTVCLGRVRPVKVRRIMRALRRVRPAKAQLRLVPTPKSKGA